MRRTQDLYVSYIKQILSGFNSWNVTNITNFDRSILPCDNIPPIPLWATQYLYTIFTCEPIKF